MPRKSRKNVGLIGLGIIGTRVAAALRSAGSHVFVWSRTPKAVPNFLGSPAEIAEICEVIQLFVSDAQAVIDTIESIGEALTSNHIIINCATIGPEATREAAKIVQEKGAAFLDAPFTGSKIAAEKGQLCYYVGGDDAVFQRVKPILEATSRAIVKCGKVGDAATLKVVTNLLTAVTTQTLAEALSIVQKSGIAPEIFAAAIEQNACKSGVIELKLPKMVRGDFDPHFSLKHMFKDVQLGIHMANSFDLEVPVTTVTAGVMYGALNNGWADLDFSSIFRIYSDSRAEEKASLPQSAEPQQIEDKKEPAEPAAPAAPDTRFVEAEIVEATIIEPEPLKEAPKIAEVTGFKGSAAEVPEPPKEAARADTIPDAFIGDIFKRRVSEPVSAQPEKEEVPATPEPTSEAPEVKATPVADAQPKPAQPEPAPDIPQVIFGRVLPQQEKTEEPPRSEEKIEEVKSEPAAFEEIKHEAKDSDLKNLAPPWIPPEPKEPQPKEDVGLPPKTEATVGEKAMETSNGAKTETDEKPKVDEPSRFRPLQRIRRFFSPAGK